MAREVLGFSLDIYPPKVIAHTMKKKEKQKPRVVVIYKSLTHYRKPFFELLRDELNKQGVEFVLVYGEPDEVETSKKDLVDIPWAHKIKNRIIKFAGRAFYWQPCLPVLENTDLIIVEQANKLLINYYLWSLNLLGITKLAFWGHGKNFQATAKDNLSETLKRFISRKVHWWFAYNKLAAKTIKTLGFQESRITVVQNAIDTRFLVKKRSEVSAKELRAFRDRTGITSSNVAVFSGGMYAEKRIGFLLQACRLIKQEVPDFEMIFLGAGPDEFLVRDAAQHQKWIHYEGAKFNEEKILYFMISKLLLMPGLVGLAVLDAFALEVPLITTNVSFHSPEIEYLETDINGVIVEPSDNVEMYSKKVRFLLKNETAREKLVKGCRKARDQYTIENMVARFSEGVEKALVCAKERGC